MKTCTALRLAKDHDLTGAILPEVYFNCVSIRDLDFPWYEKAFERQKTEIRLAWSSKFLYIHFWALDNFVAATEAKPKGKVYLDDCLELFVQPEENLYFGWEVNALGTMLEYKTAGWEKGGLVEDSHFDYTWLTKAVWKTKKHDAGWVFEMKVPFKELGRTPERGDRWRVTFNRIDLDNRSRISLSTWSELSGETVWFHQPAGFGELVFG